MKISRNAYVTKVGNHIRYYKTEKNLLKGLARFGFEDDKFLIVNEVDKGYTAIFVFDRNEGGYVGKYSYRGFMTI